MQLDDPVHVQGILTKSADGFEDYEQRIRGLLKDELKQRRLNRIISLGEPSDGSLAIPSIGAMSTAINETGARLSGDETTLRDQLSKVQDSDMYHASSEFKRTEAVLQGTLMASTKLLQPSLLNFLQ